VNEGHPGVTSAVLKPSQALQYLEYSIARRPEITVVGFAGPGDPFANPDETMETVRLVRRKYPDLLLCIATNGLAIESHIPQLAAWNVSHVTITVNAVDPAVGAKIYAWIRDGKRPMRGESAAALLWQRQQDAIRRLKKSGITVKINSIIIPGVNDRHIPAVAEAVARLGADVMNCMPMVPVEGSVFEGLDAPEGGLTDQVRSAIGNIIPQVRHCARCRADAVGLISESNAEPFYSLKNWLNKQKKDMDKARPFVAVASNEGALVNQHLGEADSLMIYERNPGWYEEFSLKEIRSAPPPGGGESRWRALAETLHDCRAMLVVSAGSNPREILSGYGLRIIEMEGLIHEGLKAAFTGNQVPAVMKRRFMGCSKGVACGGTGTGCG